MAAIFIKPQNTPAALWDEILTYWKQWECDNFGLGRIKTFGFFVFMKTDEHDSRLISLFETLPSPPLAFPLQDFPTPSLAIPF